MYCLLWCTDISGDLHVVSASCRNTQWYEGGLRRREVNHRGSPKFENCYESALLESFWSQIEADRHTHNLFDDLRQARLVVYS